MKQALSAPSSAATASAASVERHILGLLPDFQSRTKPGDVFSVTCPGHTKTNTPNCEACRATFAHELSVNVTTVDPRPKETAGNTRPHVGVSFTAAIASWTFFKSWVVVSPPLFATEATAAMSRHCPPIHCRHPAALLISDHSVESKRFSAGQSAFSNLAMREVLHKALLGNLDHLVSLRISHANDLLASVLAWLLLSHIVNGTPFEHLLHNLDVKAGVVGEEEVIYVNYQHGIDVAVVAAMGEKAMVQGVHLELGLQQLLLHLVIPDSWSICQAIAIAFHLIKWCRV